MAVWLVIVIVVAVVLALAALAWILGYPLRGLEALRASSTEAGERVADRWATFSDWLRFGR